MTRALNRILLIALLLSIGCLFLPMGLQAQEGLSEEEAARMYNMSRGWVDSIDSNAVIIDDMVIPLSRVELHDSKGGLSNVSSLKQGEYVAFDWSDTLVRVYQLDMEEARPESSASRDEQAPAVTNPGETVIRQVDGVWKN